MGLGNEVEHIADGHTIIRALPRSDVSCCALILHARCSGLVKTIPKQETNWAVVDLMVGTMALRV
eukprot:7382975-Prorocentrum_lima.AAC.1